MTKDQEIKRLHRKIITEQNQEIGKLKERMYRLELLFIGRIQLQVYLEKHFKDE